MGYNSSEARQSATRAKKQNYAPTSFILCMIYMVLLPTNAFNCHSGQQFPSQPSNTHPPPPCHWTINRNPFIKSWLLMTFKKPLWFSVNIDSYASIKILTWSGGMQKRICFKFGKTGQFCFTLIINTQTKWTLNLIYKTH